LKNFFRYRLAVEVILKYLLILALISVMGLAFYLGYMLAIKRTQVVPTDQEQLASAKTDIVVVNAKKSDNIVANQAKILNQVAKKTNVKREALQTIREDLKEKNEYPAVFAQNERAAMADLIQAQDEELKASQALIAELTIARDAWKNAYTAAREENSIQKMAQEARIAAIKGEKIKIGAISLGIGFIGGILAK